MENKKRIKKEVKIVDTHGYGKEVDDEITELSNKLEKEYDEERLKENKDYIPEDCRFYAMVEDGMVYTNMQNGHINFVKELIRILKTYEKLGNLEVKKDD